jgi:hypothetical protein
VGNVTKALKLYARESPTTKESADILEEVFLWTMDRTELPSPQYPDWNLKYVPLAITRSKSKPGYHKFVKDLKVQAKKWECARIRKGRFDR